MDKISFGEYIDKRMKELDVNQTELAEELGKSQKTVSNYVNCRDMHLRSIKVEQEIEKALKKFSSYHSYHHMKRGEFSELLHKLLKEFDLSQEELARRIGKHQKDISNYLDSEYKDINIGVKEQYDILKYFFSLCYFEYGISVDHYETAMLLYKILDNESYEDFIYMMENGDPEIDGNDDFDRDYIDCVEYILELPVKIQDFIFNNIDAFFENSIFLISLSSDIAFTYEKRMKWLRLFREMDSDTQKKVVRMLEQNISYSFPDEWAKMINFKCIAAMHNIISSDILFTDNEKFKNNKVSRSEKAQHRFKTALEKYVLNFGLLSSSAEEFKLKMSFTKFEWYFWMLLLVISLNNEKCDYLLSLYMNADSAF